MEESEAEEKNARRFLLGYLSEEERKSVEDRLDEPDYLELVLKCEHDLMVDYIANELSEDDRLRFKQHVLTNQQQIDELNLSRKLRATAPIRAAANSPPVVTEPIPTVLEKGSKSNKSWHPDFRLPIAAIILISIGFAAAFAVFWWNRSSQQLLSEELTKLNTQQSLSIEALNRGVVIGPLQEGLAREDSKNSFSIPETEQIVQLRLQIGSVPYQAFQAVLQDAEGHEIRKFDDLRPRTIDGERLAIIYVLAKDFTPGDYQIRLSGLSQTNELVQLGRYTFRTLAVRSGKSGRAFSPPQVIDIFWCTRQGSNLRPSDSKSDALSN